MNTILVTYDTRQDGERGETAVVLPISDKNLMDLTYGSSDVAHCLIEPALIAVEMLLVGVLAALWLAVGLTANWGQKRIDEAAERRHSDYRRVAARHGRRIRK